MIRLTHFTLLAALALAPSLGSAQSQLLQGNQVPSVRVLPDAPAAQPTPGTLRGAPATYSVVNQSICPPGSSLQWQIVNDPTEPGPPLGANGYVLGCS